MRSTAGGFRQEYLPILEDMFTTLRRREIIFDRIKIKHVKLVGWNSKLPAISIAPGYIAPTLLFEGSVYTLYLYIPCIWP